MTTRRTALLRHMLAACCVLLLTVLILPLTVSADDKQYSVKSANFRVSFADNGDATITEQWTVQYTSGSFTRFYKDIYNAFNQLEYIQSVDVQSCKINGNEAARSKSMDRDPGHYYLEPQSDRYTIHWFQPAENETVQYEITYVIPGALKLDEHNRASFCYRFIGENFPKTVGSVRAVFDLPENDSSANASVSYGQTSRDGEDIICTGINRRGMYKIRLDADPAPFGALGRVIDVQVPDAPKTRSSDSPKQFGLLNSLMESAPFLTFLFLILGIIFIPRIRAHHRLKKNPHCLEDAAERLDRTGIPYTWYMMLPATPGSRDMFASLYLGLFDLARHGWLTFTKGGIVLQKNISPAVQDPVQTQADINLLTRITEACRCQDAGDRVFLRYSAIREALDGNEAALSFCSGICAWLAEYKKALGESPVWQRIRDDGSLKQIVEDLNLWQKTIRFTKHRLSAYDCISLYERNGAVTSFDVLTLLLQPENRSAGTPVDDSSLFDMTSYFTTVHVPADPSGSSGSGCSSCSSCSSCSGCGGGGAD